MLLDYSVLYELSNRREQFLTTFWFGVLKTEVSALSHKSPGYIKFVMGSSENLKSIEICISD